MTTPRLCYWLFWGKKKCSQRVRGLLLELTTPLNPAIFWGKPKWKTKDKKLRDTFAFACVKMNLLTFHQCVWFNIPTTNHSCHVACFMFDPYMDESCFCIRKKSFVDENYCTLSTYFVCMMCSVCAKASNQDSTDVFVGQQVKFPATWFLYHMYHGQNTANRQLFLVQHLFPTNVFIVAQLLEFKQININFRLTLRCIA